MTSRSATFENLLYPDVPLQNWQMLNSDRIALAGLLARIRPKMALEIGVYYGGSLTLTAQFSQSIIAIDIDTEVSKRFPVPSNADIWIGNSVDLIPRALKQIESRGQSLNYVLIDADHSRQGVRRDIELVLDYQPKEPMVILMHDSGNPDCREGIKTAAWSKNPYVQWVDCDFVPGQIIEHTVVDGRGEVWGGLGLAYLNGEKRSGDLVVRESAKTAVHALHQFIR